MDGPYRRANPLVLLRPHLSRPLGVSVRNPLLARDGNPAEAEEKEQFVGSCGTWRTGEGQPTFRTRVAGRTAVPALTLFWPPLSFLLWVGWCCHFLPPQMGLFCGTGSLAVGDRGYRNPVLWPKGRGNCPCAPRTSQGNADWHHGNHILTCLKHTIPIRHCYPLCLQLAGLSQNACLSARYLAIFLLNPHNCSAESSSIPADRSPTQVSSSQTWNLLLT